MIYIYPNSSKLIEFVVKDLPSPVESAVWTLRESPEAEALLTLTIAPDSGEDGQVVDTGEDGEAGLSFYISGEGLTGLDQDRFYSSACKVTLENTESFILPESIQPVRYRPIS